MKKFQLEILSQGYISNLGSFGLNFGVLLSLERQRSMTKRWLAEVERGVAHEGHIINDLLLIWWDPQLKGHQQVIYSSLNVDVQVIK